MLAANLAYRASSVRFAQSRGYDVSLREPGSADDDLAFLGGADTFIAGGGGYSLAAFVVSYALCGTVLFPQRICDRSPNSRNRKRARENAASTQCSRRGAFVGGMFQRVSARLLTANPHRIRLYTVHGESECASDETPRSKPYGSTHETYPSCESRWL